MRTIVLLSAVLSLDLAPGYVSAHAQDQASPPASSDQAPLLSFDQLVALSGTAHPDGSLGAQLQTLLETPFLRNDANRVLADPDPRNSSVLRVGLWNIERGLNLDPIRAALTDTHAFEKLAGTDRLSPSRREVVESQLAALQGVDVLVLNEADWGMKRTRYRNVTAKLAAALHMNSAFGVEFVEVDPIFALGTEQVLLPDPAETRRLQNDLNVDANRYLGLHGTAVLEPLPHPQRADRAPACLLRLVRKGGAGSGAPRKRQALDGAAALR
jgi:hypothetical protein